MATCSMFKFCSSFHPAGHCDSGVRWSLLRRLSSSCIHHTALQDTKTKGAAPWPCAWAMLAPTSLDTAAVLVQANLRYSAVMQRIRPLTQELDKLQASLAAGATRLQQCRAELATLDERKAGLQADLAARTDEAAELKAGPSLPCALAATGHCALASACCGQVSCGCSLII